VAKVVRQIDSIINYPNSLHPPKSHLGVEDKKELEKKRMIAIILAAIILFLLSFRCFVF